MAEQQHKSSTSMYIFVGIREDVKSVVSQALDQRKHGEKWGLLVNEPGLFSSEQLSEIEWREVFGCACCTQGNSPVLRTSIVALLRLKPKRLLVVLSSSSEPSRLLPMVEQYFGKVAPLRLIIFCTNEISHNNLRNKLKFLTNGENEKEAMNEAAYQDQFELADVVISTQNVHDQNNSNNVYDIDNQSKLVFLNHWTDFDHLTICLERRIAPLPFNHINSMSRKTLSFDNRNEQWLSCPQIQNSYQISTNRFLSLASQCSQNNDDKKSVYFLTFGWLLASEHSFNSTDINLILQNMLSLIYTAASSSTMTCPYSKNSFFQSVSCIAILKVREGGFRCQTARLQNDNKLNDMSTGSLNINDDDNANDTEFKDNTLFDSKMNKVLPEKTEKVDESKWPDNWLYQTSPRRVYSHRGYSRIELNIEWVTSDNDNRCEKQATEGDEEMIAEEKNEKNCPYVGTSSLQLKCSNEIHFFSKVEC